MCSMQISEQELIARSISHDADAYGQLVERYKHAIYRHCFAIVRDEDTAEDIAQETFIAAYYKLTSFDSSKRLSTWLFKIATNKALNYLRDNKRLQPLEQTLIDKVVSPHTLPHQLAEYEELHSAIARLEPRYQAVISLHYFEGMEYHEIADVLGKPMGSVKGWLNRAKQQLRKELA